MAVNRIIVSKFGNCTGQACIAVDYILVEKRFASALVWMWKMHSNLCFYINSFSLQVKYFEMVSALCSGGTNEGFHQKDVWR